MSQSILCDTFIYTGSGASVLSFTPNLPTGASIGQVFVDALSSAASVGAATTVAQTITSIAAGGSSETSTTVSNLAGTTTTVTKLTVSSLSWSSGSTSSAPSVTLTLSAAVTNTYVVYIQYLIGFDG